MSATKAEISGGKGGGYGHPAGNRFVAKRAAGANSRTKKQNQR
ncbi:MAG TPA: hypothetical protein VKP30_08580 [Polyangiaceae bacterium]|nr:hypothetical protein [Polyangiaceae bacterium]